jgi:antitoxin component YwqK of YwqJK toxin-antitoxin module
MRPKPSACSGAAGPRTLVVVVLLAIVAGFLVFLVNPPTTKAPPAGISSGPTELERTNLVLEEKRLRQPGSPIAFTGLMVEHYPDGALRSRSAVSNGLLQGLSEGWHTNGQQQVSEQFKEGFSHGLRTKWHPNGAKLSEASIVEGKLQGPFRRWHENGALAEQVEFVADQPEGLSLSFFPSGYLKARVVMKEGKPLEQKFWKDGEMKP